MNPATPFSIRIAGRARIVAIANQKGGVGKTTTTANLGALLAALGYRVLLVDGDSSATLSQTFLDGNPNQLKVTLAELIKQGLDADQPDFEEPLPTAEAILPLKENLDLLPASDRLTATEKTITEKLGQGILTEVLAPVFDTYDLIIVDTVPSLRALHIIALYAAHEVLIPVAPTHYDSWGIPALVGSIRTVRKANRNLTIRGLILNRVQSQTSLSAEIKAGLEATKIPILGTIRQATSVASAPGARQTIFEYDPTSKAADDYRKLGAELINAWTEITSSTPEVSRA